MEISKFCILFVTCDKLSVRTTEMYKLWLFARIYISYFCINSKPLFLATVIDFVLLAYRSKFYINHGFSRNARFRQNKTNMAAALNKVKIVFESKI